MTNDSPKLMWVMPGFVAYKVPLPEGSPDGDSLRARMLRSIATPPTAFAGVPDKELSDLGISAAMALCRAEYHEARFKSVLGSLEARRNLFQAEVTSDLLITHTLYEAAAALGAVRLTVDELLHLIARRHGELDSDKIERRWAASLVMNDKKFAKATYADVEEVRLLRSHPHSEWFTELNDYRNALFHRGWREMYGHYYPRAYRGKRGLTDTADALVVPDRSSLKGKAKPHQWTFAEQVRLEDIVERGLDGLRAWLDAVCTGAWGLSAPNPGTEPEAPNLFVRVPMPIVYYGTGIPHIPFFTNEEGAMAFWRVNDKFEGELRQLPRAAAEPLGFMFSLAHLDKLKRPLVVRLILDPTAGVSGLSGPNFSDIEIPTEDRALLEPRMIMGDVANSEKVLCWAPTPESLPLTRLRSSASSLRFLLREALLRSRHRRLPRASPTHAGRSRSGHAHQTEGSSFNSTDTGTTLGAARAWPRRPSPRVRARAPSAARVVLDPPLGRSRVPIGFGTYAVGGGLPQGRGQGHRPE